MVNDLSTLSRAERAVADAPETISVKELVTSLYHEYQPEAATKGLTFDLDTSAHLGTVSTSPLYLKELMQNLITNAIKYTPHGGITLRAHTNDNKVSLEVRDTGIGISRSDQS
jgi:signal transduction histidine kinase